MFRTPAAFFEGDRPEDEAVRGLTANLRQAGILLSPARVAQAQLAAETAWAEAEPTFGASAAYDAAWAVLGRLSGRETVQEAAGLLGGVAAETARAGDVPVWRDDVERLVGAVVERAVVEQRTLEEQLGARGGRRR